MIWTVNLGAEAPQKRAIALAAACFAGFIGLAALKSVPLALVGFVLIISSTGELFFPLKLTLSEEGVTSRCGLSNDVAR